MDIKGVPIRCDPEPGASTWRIGPYRVVREIGHGGMAVVLLAERDDGEFEQRVALKLIKPGLDTEQVLRRFCRERQILASLEHPAIAGLVDGGVTEDGRPYLAMEYVEGVPIDVFCFRHRLSMRQRLKLVDAAAEAVEHAHRNLVIHKDLKPDNILVAEDGRVTLLDFGIASVLEPERGSCETRPSCAGVRMMTPEMASPEQLRGEPLTTAVDVFQLGVLLYLLLTGKHPYVPQGSSAQEIQRAVLEHEPRPPSQATGRDWRRRSGPSGKPGLDGEIDRAGAGVCELDQGRLRGDLDAIILMAMRKEPEQRYASVRELRDDIRRHLEGRPVRARRQRMAYVAGRFVRRHVAAVLSATAVLLSVACLTGVYMAQLAHERDRVRAEARRAAQVAGFLQGLFESSESDQVAADQVSARELLDRGAERIRNELDGQPETRAEILAVLGRISHKLGAYDRAELLLEEALSVAEHVHGEDHFKVATALRDLGILYYDLGKHSEAEPLYQRALAIREQTYGSRHQDVAACVNSLAILRYDQGRYEEAEALYQRVLEIWEEVYGPDHHEVATALQNLAILYRRQGRHSEAEPMYRRSLEIKERALGPDHPGVASCVNSLAILCYDQGRYDEAESFHRRALKLREQIYGPDHPEVAVSLNNLALLHSNRGELTLAGPLYQRAIAIWEEALGPDHPFIASGLNNLAGVELKRGQVEAAEPLIRRALAIRTKAYGADHPAVAECFYLSAGILAGQGEHDDADALYRRVVESWEGSLGPAHPALVSVLNDHARLLVEAERYDEAQDQLRRCRGICDGWASEGEVSDGEKVVVASVYLTAGELHHLQGEPELARASWNEAVDLAMSVSQRTEDAGGLEIGARALLHLGRVEEAEPAVERLRQMGWRSPELLSLCRQHGLAG